MNHTLDFDTTAGGAHHSLYTPLTAVNVHLRGGAVLPLQQARMTSTQSRGTPFTLLAALSAQQTAHGSLFFDDGEQLQLVNYISVQYDVAVSGGVGVFTANVSHNSYAESKLLRVQTVKVLGVGQRPSSAVLNEVVLADHQIEFDEATQSVAFTALGLTLAQGFTLQWK